MGMRIFVYVVLMIIGVAYVLHSIRKEARTTEIVAQWDNKPLPIRHTLVLTVLGLGIAFLVYASQTWKWKYNELSAYYISLGVIFAVIGGLSANDTINAFILSLIHI